MSTEWAGNALHRRLRSETRPFLHVGSCWEHKIQDRYLQAQQIPHYSAIEVFCAISSLLLLVVYGGRTAPARRRARHDSLHIAKAARYCVSGSQGPDLPAWDSCDWARNLKPHEIPSVAHLERFVRPAFCPTPQHGRARVRQDGPFRKPPDTPKRGTSWALNHGTRDARQEARPLKPSRPTSVALNLVLPSAPPIL